MHGTVKRILRYLKGTVSRGIAMQKHDHFQIIGYSDSDWAGNALDRKSTTGYCTFVGANHVFHERTKHIEVDCHFIRNQVQAKIIETVYTRSCDQLADLFTKVLPSAQFEHLLSKLGSRFYLDLA
ncbi:hypothetical protein ACLB2K_041417 [Fragaria x ananassa]